VSNPVVESGAGELERIDLWSDFKGIDLTSPGPAVSRDHARRAHSLRVDDTGFLHKVEDLIADASYASGETGISLFVLPISTSRAEIYVGTTVGFQWKDYDAGLGAWAKLTGPVLAVSTLDNRFSFVRWNSLILALSPESGIALQALDTAAKTYAAVAGSPAGFHVTAFGNRVVVSRVTGNIGRIQWSVKNDSTDWSGLGSGFEDLLAAAGSNADRPWSVWPLGETQAIVICERSVFLMSATDNFDAPFRFTLIPGAEGTPYPYSIAAVPGGVMYAGWNDVWFISTERFERMAGSLIAPALFGYDHGTDLRISTALSAHAGVYVPATGEYWLKAGTTTYRCNIGRKAWTTDVITGAGNMAFVEAKLPASEVRDWAVFHASNGTTPGRSTGSISGVGGRVPELISGDIELDQPEYRLDVMYVSVLYQTRDTTPRVIEIYMSRNDGNWELYSSFTTKPFVSSVLDNSPTNRTHVATIQKGITADKIAFRLIYSIFAPDRLRIVRFSVHCSKSGWTPVAR